jgi:hypothetical protein
MEKRMINLTSIDTILSNNFKINNKVLEEKAEKMKITFETRSGLQCLCYKYDDNLAGYKGGLFPFFSTNMERIHSIVDYIIFAEYQSKIIVLIFELKKGKAETWPQFKAAENFVDFIFETAKRVHKSDSSNFEKRFISVREFQLKKGKTLMKNASFDINRHFNLKHNHFCLNDLIK